MKMSSNTILITGGTSGIGCALAERFLKAGNEVIICGRRAEKLTDIQAQYPLIHTRICDVGVEGERVALFEWAVKEFPGLNVLVNNAGIQQRLQLVKPDEWKRAENEVVINFLAPVHLSLLFIPHLIQQREPIIMNVTSGLAFAPMARAPIYCATKAALRSFTLSLRHQLSTTPVSVIEVIPPAVNTDLGGPGLHTTGVPLAEFADAVMERLKSGALEISYGFSEKSSHASRQDLDEMFKRMNQ